MRAPLISRLAWANLLLLPGAALVLGAAGAMDRRHAVTLGLGLALGNVLAIARQTKLPTDLARCAIDAASARPVQLRPLGEETLAVMTSDRVVGSARLTPLAAGTVAAGLHLERRTARTTAAGALQALLVEAAASGATVVVAETRATDRAALAALRSCGGTLAAADAGGRVRAELRL